MGTLEPDRVVELADGIRVEFADGAEIALTLRGVGKCSLCGVNGCRHYRAVEAIYRARRWELLEGRARCWGIEKWVEVNVDPRIFIRPGECAKGLYGLFSGWKPTVEMIGLEVAGGYVFSFADGGHLWLSESHPEGGTKCLQCGTRDCEHWQRARAEVEAWEAANGDGD